MFSRLSPFIGQYILEVAWGVGNFTRLWLDRKIIVATDVYGPGVENLKLRLGGNVNVVPVQLDTSDRATLNSKSMNVIP